MGGAIISLAIITLGVVEYSFWVQMGVGNIEGVLLSNATLFRNPCLALLLVYLGIFLSKDLRHVIRDEILSKVKVYTHRHARLISRLSGGFLVAVTVYVFYSLIPAINIGFLMDDQKSLGYALIALPLVANFVLLNAPGGKHAHERADDNTIYLRRR